VLNSYLKVLAQSAEGGKVGAEEAKGMLARMRELNVPVDVITMSTVMEILVAAVRYVYAVFVGMHTPWLNVTYTECARVT